MAREDRTQRLRATWVLSAWLVDPVLIQHGPIGSPELLQLGLPRLWTEKLQGPLFVLSLESCHGSGPDPRMWPWQSVGRIGMVLALVIVAQCLVVEGRQKTFKTVKDLERHLGSKLHCPGHPYDQQWAAWEAEAKRGYYIRA